MECKIGLMAGKKIQDSISTKHNNIEFRRSGSIGYRLDDRQFLKEKTVDVNLAVDLLKLKGIYDIAILVSGDQDYVPVVNEIQNLGKVVVNVVFKKRNGSLLPGGAWRLNKSLDSSIELDYQQVKELLNC